LRRKSVTNFIWLRWLAFHGLGRRICAVSCADQIGEDGFILIACKEFRELAPKPVGKGFLELTIAAVFKMMEHQRADQDLTPGVLGAILRRLRFSGQVDKLRLAGRERSQRWA